MKKIKRHNFIFLPGQNLPAQFNPAHGPSAVIGLIHLERPFTIDD
jgi:hypothetical protein